MLSSHKRCAFSLVELSIVLVILGLLVGGILVGKSLIRASELRAITTEYQRYLTAANAFKDKYFAIPGDFSNATLIWGKDTTLCNGHTGSAPTSGSGTCNGNADRQVTSAGGAGLTGEMYQFWNQLSLAGLIEGTYSGAAGPGSNLDAVIGTNVPASKLTNAGWTMYRWNTFSGSSTVFDGDYGNPLIVGADNSTSYTLAAAFRPEEAWNIDTKLDDGIPGRGKVIAYSHSACTNAADSTDLDTTYLLTNSTLRCALVFSRAVF